MRNKDSTTEQQIRTILRKSYDLHVHTAPSHRPRSLDDFGFLMELDKFEMAGGIIKNHNTPTSERAALVNQHGNAKAKLYGAIALNCSVGGINPAAVKSALDAGAKMVWLPTLDVKRGLSALSEKGELRPEVYEIFDLVKEYKVGLATGHLPPKESLIVCKEAIRCRVDKMILTHPDAKKIEIPLENQIAVAHAGVMIEKVWGNVYDGLLSSEEMAASLNQIGAEHIFLTTDFGQKNKPLPSMGMHDFVQAMLNEGISENDLITMVRHVPAQLLNAG